MLGLVLTTYFLGISFPLAVLILWPFVRRVKDGPRPALLLAVVCQLLSYFVCSLLNFAFWQVLHYAEQRGVDKAVIANIASIALPLAMITAMPAISTVLSDMVIHPRLAGFWNRTLWLGHFIVGVVFAAIVSTVELLGAMGILK